MTVLLHGPNYPIGVQTGSSQDLRLEVSVKETRTPQPSAGTPVVSGARAVAVLANRRAVTGPTDS